MSKKDVCPFYHPLCRHGCTKADCRSRFPERAPLIMEDQKAICQSAEHLDCERYKDGVAYREEKQLSRVGCPFLHDKICGKPGVIMCTGNVPPFPIEGDNLKFVEACYSKDYASCPSYQMGVAFAAEAKRKAAVIK